MSDQKFVASQADIEWTVDLWKGLWRSQGKVYVGERLLDAASGTSISIHQFIDGFVMLSGFGGDWKAEMSKFYDIALEKIENAAKDRAVKEFLDNLYRVDWEKASLVDSEENVHKYILQSDHQVITESCGSYFVWDKASATCMIGGCEDLKIGV